MLFSLILTILDIVFQMFIGHTNMNYLLYSNNLFLLSGTAEKPNAQLDNFTKKVNDWNLIIYFLSLSYKAQICFFRKHFIPSMTANGISLINRLE